jgi:hypothetical protein
VLFMQDFLFLSPLIFFLVAALICFLSFRDTEKILVRATKGFDVGRLHKLRFVKVFRGNILEPYLFLGFRLRLWLWPLVVTLVLAVACIWGMSRQALFEILPYLISARLLPSLEGYFAVQTGALMLFSYLLIIGLPSLLEDIELQDRSREAPLKRKILNAYNRAQRRFVEDIVLRHRAPGSKRAGEYVAGLAVELEHQIKQCFRKKDEVEDFLEELARSVGLRNPSPHQTIIAYLNSAGVQGLLRVLESKECKEYRIHHRLEMILESAESERRFQCFSREFTCEGWDSVKRITLEKHGQEPPPGEYWVRQIANKKLRGRTRGVLVSVSRRGSSLVIECNSSTRLGKILAKDIRRG